ncbi:MAG TPA: hypothetical protein VGT44_22165 [Ktedonobacteraceae bacterium]|nr:hypothetical protein [Ktedonobacteraceae bacterium]
MGRKLSFPRKVLLLLLLIPLGVGLTYAWQYLHPPAPKPRPASPPVLTYKPVVGDVNDPEEDDPDIAIQQSLIPGFQFKQGGYVLSGIARDARTGQPVADAVVWIGLPARAGQPTSPALHTVADAGGNFQFNHLATDVYTLVASRYYNIGDNRYYAERVFSHVTLQGNRSGLVLSLTSIPAPGRRSIGTGRPQNLIVIDLRGFYADSLLNDPLLVNETPNLRAFLRYSTTLTSLWQPYGWRPPDQYALLTGSYPRWATYDTWPNPVPWGVPDGIDTQFWFTGGRSAHLFGQESIFDVAKGYGMQTGVVAGSDFVLSDATTRNLDLLQQDSAFAPRNWLAQMQDAVLSGAQQANGFMLYGELAPLSADDANASPDASGDAYQQALLRADQTIGQLLAWLGQQGLLQHTLIALTTSQAQANHTDADNYYGMGITGQGTSKQTMLALSWPGGCIGRGGTSDTTVYSSFVIAPILMRVMGLPAPAEARLSAPGGCI